MRQDLLQQHDEQLKALKRHSIRLQTVKAAANALIIALGKLTDSEKKLYRSVTRFRALFQKGGPLNAVTDPIISAFADGLDSLASMLKSPAVLELPQVCKSDGQVLQDFATFMTTGRMRSAFIFFR